MNDIVEINKHSFGCSKEILIKNSIFFGVLYDTCINDKNNILKFKTGSLNPSETIIGYILDIIHRLYNGISYVNQNTISNIMKEYKCFVDLLKYFRFTDEQMKKFHEDLSKTFVTYKWSVNHWSFDDIQVFADPIYGDTLVKWLSKQDQKDVEGYVWDLVHDTFYGYDKQRRIMDQLIDNNINPFINMGSLTKQFKKNLKKYSFGLFDDEFLHQINWKNVMIGGGTVINCLNDKFNKWSNINLWVNIDQDLSPLFILLKQLRDELIKKFSDSICYSHNGNVITIYCVGFKRNIQIIYSSKNHKEIVEGFNEDYVKVFYNGDTLTGTLEFARSLMSKSVIKVKKASNKGLIKASLKEYMINTSITIKMLNSREDVLNKYLYPTLEEYNDQVRMNFLVKKIMGHYVLFYNLNKMMEIITCYDKDDDNDNDDNNDNNNDNDDDDNKTPQIIHVHDAIKSIKIGPTINKDIFVSTNSISFNNNVDPCAPLIGITDPITTSLDLLCHETDDDSQMGINYNAIKIQIPKHGMIFDNSIDQGVHKFYTDMEILDNYFQEKTSEFIEKPAVYVSLIRPSISSNGEETKSIVLSLLCDRDDLNKITKINTKLVVDGESIEASNENLKKYLTDDSVCTYTYQVSQLINNRVDSIISIRPVSWYLTLDRYKIKAPCYLELLCHKIEVDTHKIDEDE